MFILVSFMAVLIIGARASTCFLLFHRRNFHRSKVRFLPIFTLLLPRLLLHPIFEFVSRFWHCSLHFGQYGVGKESLGESACNEEFFMSWHTECRDGEPVVVLPYGFTIFLLRCHDRARISFSFLKLYKVVEKEAP